MRSETIFMSARNQIKNILEFAAVGLEEFRVPTSFASDRGVLLPVPVKDLLKPMGRNVHFAYFVLVALAFRAFILEFGLTTHKGIPSLSHACDRRAVAPSIPIEDRA